MAGPDRLLDRLAQLDAGARVLPALDGLSGVHLVGGAARDLLLGREPVEIDLAVEGDAVATAHELASRLGGRVAAVHDAFGTATVEAPEGLTLDLARTRSETYARPGALPDVRPAAIEDDLARRDFSVNAIAVGLTDDVRGAVTQHPAALEDLRAGVLRVLHDRSFEDDPTRLGRLVRYAARLGFTVEERTAELARAAFAADAPATAGPARMGAELLLLLREPAALEGLALLRDLGGAQALEVDEALLSRVAALAPDDAVREGALLATLLLGRDPAEAARCLDGMHVPAPDRILDALRGPEHLAAALRDAVRPSDLLRATRGRSAEAVVVAGARGAEGPAREWLGDLRHARLRIRGADLVEAGVPAGPDVGRRLRAALEAKVDEGLETREDELRAALEA